MTDENKDLVERLREEAERLSGHSIDRGSVDAGLSSNLANEAADALSRIAAERDEATGKLSLLIDRVVYSDSYGVPGSDFLCCHLCNGGGAPGVPFEHDERCPVRHLDVIAEGWFDANRERDQALLDETARALAAESERDELKAERDRVVEALKPFTSAAIAEAVKAINPQIKEFEPVTVTVTKGQFITALRAREALNGRDG